MKLGGGTNNDCYFSMNDGDVKYCRWTRLRLRGVLFSLRLAGHQVIDGLGGFFVLVEYVVDFTADGHVDLMLLGNFVNRLRCFDTFGNHFHR